MMCAISLNKLESLFSMNDHVSKRNFELVHCDIWEPYKAPSHAVFRYFLTLVDDGYSVVWVIC